MPILVMRKLRFRELKTLARGHIPPVLLTAAIILKASFLKVTHVSLAKVSHVSLPESRRWGRAVLSRS